MQNFYIYINYKAKHIDSNTWMYGWKHATKRLFLEICSETSFQGKVVMFINGYIVVDSKVDMY